MNMRLFGWWMVCLMGLGTLACLRSLDSSKIPCTTSAQCPKNYVCSAGYCRAGDLKDGGAILSDADGIRDGRGDTRLVADGDSATPIHDAPVLGSGGVGGTGDAGGSGGPGGATGEQTGTGGVMGAGGTGTSGGAVTGGAAGTTVIGAGGAGGIPASSVAGGSGGAVGPGGATGGLSSSAASATGGGGVTTGGAVSSSSLNAGGSAGASIGSSAAAGSGGTSTLSSGGASSPGGSSASSASICQPKARDCTSTLDNNCNGIPDNQETSSCACPVGQMRDCQEHPGYDGTGICKKGSQTCTVSGDKTTSSWGECTGAIGPGTEVCDAAGADENCNGQSNEGCECVNGTSVPCDCGPATTCTNGKKGTCSVSKVTLYRDFDGDGHGETQATQVCPGTAGYATSHDDCDDRDQSFYPGMQVCTSATQIKICESGGAISRPTCDYGCAGNQCHPSTDSTVGVPGYVTCTPSSSPCLASEGCETSAGSCGGTSPNFYCDGPNDCSAGYQCWLINPPRWVGTSCSTTRPTENGAALVCDPLASLCTPPLVCTRYSEFYPLYTCQ